MCTRATPQTLVLETPQQHCPILDQSKSHLPCCEHSWAEQTTGPRTMWLRVTHLTQVLHGSEQTTRKKKCTCRFAFTTDPFTERSQNVPYLASVDRPNPTHHRQSVRSIVPYLASTVRKNPLIDNPDVSTSCCVFHPLINRTQSSTNRFRIPDHSYQYQDLTVLQHRPCTVG